MPLAALYDVHGNLPALFVRGNGDSAPAAPRRTSSVRLLDNDGVHLRHTEYDVAMGAERIRATSYPQAGAFATGAMLTPPSEAQMLDAFQQGELT